MRWFILPNEESDRGIWIVKQWGSKQHRFPGFIEQLAVDHALILLTKVELAVSGNGIWGRTATEVSQVEEIHAVVCQ